MAKKADQMQLKLKARLHCTLNLCLAAVDGTCSMLVDIRHHVIRHRVAQKAKELAWSPGKNFLMTGFMLVSLHAAFAAPPATPTHLMPRVWSQVVPSTNWVVAFIALGLDRRYQRYHLSGFLTLQQLVDEYAWELAANAFPLGSGRACL